MLDSAKLTAKCHLNKTSMFTIYRRKRSAVRPRPLSRRASFPLRPHMPPPCPLPFLLRTFLIFCRQLNIFHIFHSGEHITYSAEKIWRNWLQLCVVFLFFNVPEFQNKLSRPLSNNEYTSIRKQNNRVPSTLTARTRRGDVCLAILFPTSRPAG